VCPYTNAISPIYSISSIGWPHCLLGHWNLCYIHPGPSEMVADLLPCRFIITVGSFSRVLTSLETKADRFQKKMDGLRGEIAIKESQRKAEEERRLEALLTRQQEVRGECD
jgi:hypothetical protein